MIYKEFKNDTYNIYTIKTDKFKTCHLEIIFRNNIDNKDITKRSILTEMLVENSKNYPTRKEMMVELENLYNSYLYGVTNRVGKSILTSYCFDFINPDLVNEKLDKFLKFPIDVIFNPNVKNNEFDNKTFNYIKERIRKDIESIIEDPKKYSIDKLLKNMCSETESSINLSGNLDDLNLITNSNLYDYYEYMLQHDYIDVYIIGDLDMDEVANIISENLKLSVYKDHEINYEIINKKVKKVKKIIEKSQFSQENICIGINIDNPTKKEKNYVAQLYNIILGGGSLETKLYSYLRGENSLCYNCVSLYQKFDNLIIIHTAISKENELVALKLINKAINDINKGDIGDEELENAKKSIISTLNMSFDNPGRIIDNYVFKNLYGLDDLEVRINNYNKITKEEIIEFSKKISLNTILCLRDGENEKDKNSEN